MFTLVREVIVAGRRPISTSTLNINSCSMISRVRVDGLLWDISKSINISFVITIGVMAGRTWPTSTTSEITWGSVVRLNRPISMTFTTSTITWGRVAGIKIPMFTNFLTQRHFDNFFFRTLVVVMMAGGRMAGLIRTISQTSITPHSEWNFLLVPISLCDEWFWGNYLQEPDGIGEVGRNGKWDSLVALIFIVTVIRTPYGDPLIFGFVGLQRPEAGQIKTPKSICNSTLLLSKEIKPWYGYNNWCTGKFMECMYIYSYTIDVRAKTCYV